MRLIRRVGVVGFEPAIQGSLESLLAGEPGFAVTHFPPNWSPEGPDPEATPDVLIIAPPDSDWVARLHAQFPQTNLVAMVDWRHRDSFRESAIKGYFERFQSYSGLLELLRESEKNPENEEIS